MRVFWLAMGVLVVTSGVLIGIRGRFDHAAATAPHTVDSVPIERATLEAESTPQELPADVIPSAIETVFDATIQSVSAPVDGGSIEEKDNGTLLLDGWYTLKGRGISSDPYIIEWPLLASMKRWYSPMEGREEIPGHLELLNGSSVRLRGYVMNPTLTEKISEFVLMENSWDSCCLGLPPTAYDSVEVTLTGATPMPDLQHALADVTGEFHIEPNLFGGALLVGLYTIDSAEMTVRGSATP